MEGEVRTISAAGYRNYAFLAVAGSVLCVTSQLKFASIQFLEIIYFIEAAAMTLWLLTHPHAVTLFRPILHIGQRWALFCFLAVAVSMFSLGRDFYYPEPFGFFNSPGIVSVARISEVVMDVLFMLIMADAYRRSPRLSRLAIWSYYWVGVIGAVTSILAFLTQKAVGFQLPFGVAPGGRMIGFNNEGGPYGSYLLSVIFLTLLMRTMGLLRTEATVASMVLFAAALLGSGSKAALFQILLFFVLTPILRARGMRSVGIFCGVIALIVVVWFAGLSRIIQPMLRTVDNYKTISYLRPNDGNAVYGRVAGIYLVPRMIAAHPLTGVGLGNYVLVRDDPQYRQGANQINALGDSSSLGIFDYLSELGFPVTIIMLWAEFATVIPPIRNRGTFPIICLLLIQPVANWFGTHLNLTYPWVCGAIALGVYYGEGHLGTKKDPRAASGIAHSSTNSLPVRALA